MWLKVNAPPAYAPPASSIHVSKIVQSIKYHYYPYQRALMSLQQAPSLALQVTYLDYKKKNKYQMHLRTPSNKLSPRKIVIPTMFTTFLTNEPSIIIIAFIK